MRNSCRLTIGPVEVYIAIIHAVSTSQEWGWGVRAATQSEAGPGERAGGCSSLAWSWQVGERLLKREHAMSCYKFKTV
jgi:hypothetical protein